MQPKIIALAGPLAGSSFALPAKEGCVGRAPYNWLAINSLTVSRQHFQFEWSDAGWRLIDLDSHNGTFVNDTPVKERLLVNGDRIAAGDSHFVFVTEEQDLAPTPPRREGSTLRTMTVLALDSSGELAAGVTTRVSASERRLNALLRIGAAIPAARNHQELRAAVSVIILEALPAISAEMYSLDDPAAVTLASKAMQSRQAVLAEDGETRAMAVPLMVAGEVMGAIYVEGAAFGDEDLELLAALTTFTALAVDSLRRVSSLQAENRRLRDESGLVHEMVGESAAMQRVYEVLRKAAPTAATVLILGENGTGKELAARAIHRNSLRKDMSFVAINCATLKDTLLESELFGHEKGAFTGAVTQKIGKLEFAGGGTLFLDEIGELELGIQAKLLRVLQEREYERLGGLRTLTADVRLIAATNRDLLDLVKQGRFREDLFYRLNVVSFSMPPLRKRREDIPLLAAHFLSFYGSKCSRRITGIGDEAKQLLVRHDWPGNVRELQNTIERAVVLGSSEMIEVEDLPEQLLEGAADPHTPLPAFHQGLQDAKRKQILDAILRAGGNISEAARQMGVHPNYLHRLVTKLGLRDQL